MSATCLICYNTSPYKVAVYVSISSLVSTWCSSADVEDVNVYNTIQEQTASRYYVTDDVKLKKDYENKMIFEATEHNQKNNLGKTSLDKDIRGIKSDLFLSDVDKLIANKEYTKAENKLKDVDSSPFLDNDDRQKRLIKIQKEGEAAHHQSSGARFVDYGILCRGEGAWIEGGLHEEADVANRPTIRPECH